MALPDTFNDVPMLLSLTPSPVVAVDVETPLLLLSEDRVLLEGEADSSPTSSPSLARVLLVIRFTSLLVDEDKPSTVVMGWCSSQ